MTNKVGFVMISTGPFSRTCKTEVCLESMYRIARYEGKAFVITDSPECHDLQQIRERCGSDNIHLVPVKKFSDKFDTPVTVVKRKFSGINFPVLRFITPMKRPKSKALKARVFDLIPDEDIKVLIYTDADVIFMREEGLDELWKFATENWTREEMRFRITRYDNPEKTFNRNCKIHGGFFIVHRQYSRRGLEHWGKIMDQRKYWVDDVTDKEKFLRAYGEAEDSEGTANYMAVRPIPDHFEVFLDPDQINGLIGHISHGRIKHHGRKKIEAFLTNFNLKSYPSGYYTLPGLPGWLYDLFFFGYPGYRRAYKIEYLWKNFRSRFIKDQSQL